MVHTAVPTTNEHGYVSVNMEMIMGDWTPVPANDGNDLFFGFWFTNGGAAPGSVDSFWLSASIHRYEGDLSPWDPNR